MRVSQRLLAAWVGPRKDSGHMTLEAMPVPIRRRSNLVRPANTARIVLSSGERGDCPTEIGVRQAGRGAITGAGLEGAYAVVRESSGQKAIMIPRRENEDIGRAYAISDIWAY